MCAAGSGAAAPIARPSTPERVSCNAYIIIVIIIIIIIIITTVIIIIVITMNLYIYIERERYRYKERERERERERALHTSGRPLLGQGAAADLVHGLAARPGQVRRVVRPGAEGRLYAQSTYEEFSY